MTVKELIKRLQELPEDSEVIVFNDRLQKSGYYNVENIYNNHMGEQIELTIDYSERV